MWFSNDSRKTDNRAFTPIIHIIQPATCSTQGKGGGGWESRLQGAIGFDSFLIVGKNWRLARDF